MVRRPKGYMRNSGFRGPSRFRGRSDVMVKNWFVSTSLAVVNGTAPGAASVIETEVASLDLFQQTAAGARMSTAFKGLKLLAMTYQMQCAYLTVTGGVTAIGLVADGLFQAEKTSLGSSAMINTQFLMVNELLPGSNPTQFPERLFFRRLGMQSLGANGNGNAPGTIINGISNSAPIRVRLNANLDETQALYHRIEATNSTATTQTLVIQMLGALAFRTLP